MKHKQNKSKNTNLFLFITSFIIVFVVSAYASSLISFIFRTMEYNIEQRIIAVSKNAARIVSAEELDRYRNPEDMALTPYRRLRQKLQEFSAEYDIRYVYYLRRSGEKLQYIVDNNFNEKTRLGLDTPPDTQLPRILEAFGGKTVCSGLGKYTPGREGILTSYSPVFDKEGNVPVIAGVDIHDGSIVLARRMVDILILVQIIAVIVVFTSGIVSLLCFRREAQKANEASMAKSSFLSRMSHEIRTPLNAIIGMSELALRSGTLSKMAEYARGIKQAGQNLLSLINDILDFSKIETGNLQISQEPYSLASLLNDIINVMRIRISEKPILFFVNAGAELPANCMGDEARLRQILFNLLSNAVKFTHQGFIHLRVSAVARKDSRNAILLTLSVSDSGVGIKKEDMPNLFNDFVRLDLSRNKSITGLGLTITRSLCRGMGGDIHLESEYGKGSVFSVTIPQLSLDDAKLAKVENAESKGVLLADHRSDYAASLMETLKNLGVPVTIAADTDDLIEKLSRGGFPYAFVSARFLEPAQAAIRNSPCPAVLVLLAALGEASAPDTTRAPAVQHIPMPAYAVNIAGTLNAKRPVQESKDPGGRVFIVPGVRILVVDDIATNLKVAAGLLSSYQAGVDTCLSGAEAIALAREGSYDIVFMDHLMPEMDGIEAAGKIRELDNCRNLPIVALTANAANGVQAAFLEHGFNAFLSKPIEAPQLDEVLKTLLPAEKIVAVNTFSAAEGQAHLGPFNGLAVEGIDLDAGLERYHDAFPEILRSYCKDTAPLLDKLRRITTGVFSEDSLKDYAIVVHGLKGSSYGIFAGGLGKLAEFMERTAKAGDFQTIQAQNNSFIEIVERLLASLEELLQHISAGETRRKAAAPDPDLLQKLAQASKHYRANAMSEILGELEKYDYESGGELVNWLRERADDLDYEAIWKRLNPVQDAKQTENQ
ncbi:MAG: response regulator [Treponema sp.]|jgi:signal transduction histidine kinase/CheY-like chemotaxis protein|nr:response regulator [Treponema sp.]